MFVIDKLATSLKVKLSYEDGMNYCQPEICSSTQGYFFLSVRDATIRNKHGFTNVFRSGCLLLYFHKKLSYRSCIRVIRRFSLQGLYLYMLHVFHQQETYSGGLYSLNYRTSYRQISWSLEPRDWMLSWLCRSQIWQASWQRCCRSACQIRKSPNQYLLTLSLHGILWEDVRRLSE